MEFSQMRHLAWDDCKKKNEVQVMKENKKSFGKKNCPINQRSALPSRTKSKVVHYIFCFYHKYCKSALHWTDCGQWTLPDACAESIPPAFLPRMVFCLGSPPAPTQPRDSASSSPLHTGRDRSPDKLISLLNDRVKGGHVTQSSPVG